MTIFDIFSFSSYSSNGQNSQDLVYLNGQKLTSDMSTATGKQILAAKIATCLWISAENMSKSSLTHLYNLALSCDITVFE